MIQKAFKLLVTTACGILFPTFILLGMTISSLGAWPGDWLMHHGHNQLLAAAGFLIAVVGALGISGICFLCALASLFGCGECVRWTLEGIQPSIPRWFSHALESMNSH